MMTGLSIANKRIKAFTLVEVAIVTVIVGVLAGGGIPIYFDIKSTVQLEALQKIAKSLESAADINYQKYQVDPDSSDVVTLSTCASTKDALTDGGADITTPPYVFTEGARSGDIRSCTIADDNGHSVDFKAYMTPLTSKQQADQAAALSAQAAAEGFSTVALNEKNAVDSDLADAQAASTVADANDAASAATANAAEAASAYTNAQAQADLAATRAAESDATPETIAAAAAAQAAADAARINRDEAIADAAIAEDVANILEDVVEDKNAVIVQDDIVDTQQGIIDTNQAIVDDANSTLDEMSDAIDLAETAFDTLETARDDAQTALNEALGRAEDDNASDQAVAEAALAQAEFDELDTQYDTARSDLISMIADTISDAHTEAHSSREAARAAATTAAQQRTIAEAPAAGESYTEQELQDAQDAAVAAQAASTTASAEYTDAVNALAIANIEKARDLASAAAITEANRITAMVRQADENTETYTDPQDGAIDNDVSKSAERWKNDAAGDAAAAQAAYDAKEAGATEAEVEAQAQAADDAATSASAAAAAAEAANAGLE